MQEAASDQLAERMAAAIDFLLSQGADEKDE